MIRAAALLLWSSWMNMLRLLVWWSRAAWPHHMICRTQVRLIMQNAQNALSEDVSKQQKMLFFCSSVGEYQQALPVVEELRRRGVIVVFCFFSPSLLRYYAGSSGAYPYILAPWDTLPLCRKVLQHINPTAVWVVRHELWPCFLAAASERGTLHLIGASVSGRRDPLRLKRFLLGFFTHIYCVRQQDVGRMRELLSPSSPAVILHVGDTKYERVLQRKHERSQSASQVKHAWQQIFHERPTLLLCSCWPADVRLIIRALDRGGMPKDLVVHLVPHEVHGGALAGIRRELQQRSITAVSFAQHSPPPQVPSPSQGFTWVLTAQLGVLFDLCSTASASWVGGACHHRVHNVLEPLVFGVPVAFGPRYQSSVEAVDLVERGLARSARTPEEVHQWLLDAVKRSEEQKKAYEHRLQREVFVSLKASASQLIIEGSGIFSPQGRRDAEMS